MPERRPTRNPDFIAGTVLESGVPNTGQILQTYGGTRTFARMSGVVGPDVAVWVGGGRLDHALLYSLASPGILAASGQPIIFYDSAVVVSGGPLNTSGHKAVGILRPNSVASGQTIPCQKVDFGTVFTSGLVMTVRSGQPACSVSFTPVISG